MRRTLDRVVESRQTEKTENSWGSLVCRRVILRGLGIHTRSPSIVQDFWCQPLCTQLRTLQLTHIKSSYLFIVTNLPKFDQNELIDPDELDHFTEEFPTSIHVLLHFYLKIWNQPPLPRSPIPITELQVWYPLRRAMTQTNHKCQ